MSVPISIYSLTPWAFSFAVARHTKVLWISSIAVVLLSASLTFTFCFASSPRFLSEASFPRSPVSPQIRLDLQVERDPGSLRLRWNAQAVSLHSPKNGILQIDDGGQHSELSLNPDQISTASATYRPTTNYVTFQLKVFDSKGSIASESLLVGDGSQSDRVTADLQASKHVSKSSGLESSSYVPARPLKQVMPDAGALSRPPSKSADVEIGIRINNAGRVTDARIIDGGANNDELFASASVMAAKEWIFEPAKMNGKDVSSDHTIAFHFHLNAGR